MSLPERSSSITHYDEIPIKCLGKTILDVGSSDGYGAVHSKHKDHFFSCDYLGIDIQHFKMTHLPVVTADILSFESECCFDTILLLHVLEHIDIEQWPKLFDKMNSFLMPNGWLVVNVPFGLEGYKGVCEPLDHKVGYIDDDLLSQYWPFQKYLHVGKHIVKAVIFRESGENFFRSCVRFVYRILAHHKHSVIRRYLRLRKPSRIVAIYQKEKVVNN